MSTIATLPDTVVLVGGLGTRLRESIGEAVPKPLAPIAGQPFLAYLFRYIQDEGLGRTVLATAHLSNAFRDQLACYAPANFEVEFSFEPSPRGTGGALVQALPMIRTDPFVTMNGDSFALAPIAAMLKSHRLHGAAVTVALVRVPDCARFGTVEFGEDDRIIAFREKTGLSDPGWINAGIYVLSKTALDSILDREVSSIERDVFPTLIGRGLYGFCVESPFIDIGVPDSYRAAESFFRERGYV